MACVYCFRVGSLDCFKIGRTKNPASERMKSVSVGSAEKLTLYRTIETEHASRLERYIHEVLAPHRAPNGEFFNLSPAQLDDALRNVMESVEASQPLLDEVEGLKRVRPSTEVLEPTAEVSALYRDLKDAKRELFFSERKVELLQSRLQVALGRNLGFRGVASWKWQDRWVLNQDLLKRDHPDIYEQYRELSGSRVFRLE